MMLERLRCFFTEHQYVTAAVEGPYSDGTLHLYKNCVRCEKRKIETHTEEQ